MKKVLVVDDDAWLADNYKLVLAHAGWQVAVAASGAEAIDLIDDTQPEVVLLDIMLPGSSAPALLNELQSHSDLANLPVVLISSLDVDENSYSDLEHYGVSQVIDKSKVTPESLISAVEGARHDARA